MSNDRNGRLIELPCDYEKQYEEAKKKLQFHEQQRAYHAANVSYYKAQIEELEPLTGARERYRARAKEQMEGSKEFQEIRKRVKRKKALTLVDIMLQRIAEEDV